MGALSGNLYLSTANTERLRIDSSGRVGIGTASPQSVLHVAGTSPQLILDPGVGSSDPVFVNSYRTNSPLGFKAGDTERARLTASGQWLVGTSSARSNFFNSNFCFCFIFVI